MDLWQKYFGDVDSTLWSNYKRWIVKNKHVFSEFRRLAEAWREAGNKKCSGWLLVNVMRWDVGIKTGDEFAINNNYVGLLARTLIVADPSYEGFFELRGLQKLEKTTGRLASETSTARE